MHALITGASRGIGEAIARDLSAEGYDVSLVARSEADLGALAATLEGKTFVLKADLSDSQACDGVVAAATDALGPVDVLVNNAGIQYVEAIEGISLERMERLFAVDLLSPFRLTHHALPSMLERGAGTIVNIASMAAVTHTPGMAYYNGAKAGLAAVSESMRVELADRGINVLTVYPGPVATDLEVAGRKSYAESWASATIPVGTTEGLAKLIRKAIKKKSARVFYPQVYGATRYTRVLSQWLTDNLTPPLANDDE